jgi:molecular chaperone DnaK (HSP70)
MTRIPTVDRIVREILNENPRRGINPGEDVVMDAAIQNLKRWCDGF